MNTETKPLPFAQRAAVSLQRAGCFPITDRTPLADIERLLDLAARLIQIEYDLDHEKKGQS